MTLNHKPNIGRAYLLPFLIYFTVNSIALLQPSYGTNLQQDTSVINQFTLTLAYTTALILILRQHGLLSYILKSAIPLCILFLLVLISSFWSYFPEKVIISFVHNVGLSLIAICMAIYLIFNKNNFFKLLLLILMLYILATIIITINMPYIGIMTSSNIYDVSVIGRWRGLTGHPNSLGIICLFTTWVCTCVLFNSKNSKWVYLLAVVTLAGLFYCLHKADSMTSLILSIALLLGISGFSLMNSSSRNTKLIKTVVCIFLFIIGLLFIYIQHPEIFTVKYFFHLIGRNENLSGRTSLWEIGLKGHEAKPFLGWSFDNLRSFMSNFKLGYGQLHNGYLDLLVRGGYISIFLFILVISQLILSIIKQALDNNKDYLIVLSLFTAVLIHNITEASIMSNSSLTWLMFLISYFTSLLTNKYIKQKII
ncbi:MAG: O-antigen ligase family protein [Methylococcaceae bacterium]|nr:O-antigen ligase family protein [Methylococcaceae bacterium]MDP3902520.1 O-antigen ligase family protein [Methylococcaceae bacterium]